MSTVTGQRTTAGPEPFLTISETAEYLACSADTVRRMISRGELRAIRVGRLIRIRPEDLRRAGKPVTRVAGGDAA